MTEILKLVEIDNVAETTSAFMIFISVCAVLTVLIVEGLKAIPLLEKIPTKLVAYIVAVVITTPVFCAMMAYMKQPIEWFMVLGSFLASFVVAKVSTSGWDEVIELKDRLVKT